LGVLWLDTALVFGPEGRPDSGFPIPASVAVAVDCACYEDFCRSGTIPQPTPHQKVPNSPLTSPVISFWTKPQARRAVGLLHHEPLPKNASVIAFSLPRAVRVWPFMPQPYCARFLVSWYMAGLWGSGYVYSQQPDIFRKISYRNPGVQLYPQLLRPVSP